MLALAAALVVAASPPPAPPARPGDAVPVPPRVEATYAHDLASPAGVVPALWPSLTYDRAQSEVFLVAEGFVRIFDASGMEVHRFGDDGSLGNVLRVAALENGDLILLTTRDGKRAYVRCDYRGDPIAEFELTGLPSGFADIQPDQLAYQDEKLFLAERGTMRVVVTDAVGRYRQSFRLGDLVAAALPPDGDLRPTSGMDAFGVDASGNLLFTSSTMFAAGVVTPSGQVRLFGGRGSRPGRFNIIGGIASDEHGNLYVTDRLRSVVSVWSRDLRHLGDFGYRGSGPSNLLAPYEIAVGNGKVFVAQAGRRGVKVFRVRIVEPEPAPSESPAPAKAPPTGPDRPPPRKRGLG